MYSAAYVGPRLKAFESAPQFDGYTRVVISVADGVEISSGTTTGRTLRLTNPWGTQEIADNILRLVQGFQYQPYSAAGAQVEPAAEIGDGITVNDVYSGLYKQSINYGRLSLSTIEAPTEQATDHEYPYKSRPNKEVTREARLLRSSLRVQADRITAEVEARESDVASINSVLDIQASQIEAKVAKTGGDASSFGWTLDERSWTIKSNGTDILKATQGGLEVYGKVTATSGKIGGFDIGDNSLQYNNQAWEGTNTTGIYIGVNGIQLGQNFKVDSQGNLTASSGKFTGAVYAGNIEYGGEKGYMSGGGLGSGSVSGGKLINGTITTTQTGAGINTSLAHADYANSALTGGDYVNIGDSLFYFGGKLVYKNYISVDGVSRPVLMWVP